MKSNLYEACLQWASRPPDERFASIDEMLAACKSYHATACEAQFEVRNFKAVAEDDEVFLAGLTGVHSRLSHWSFGQLSAWARAPAHYLRRLPATVAADCLNSGFSALKTIEKSVDLMFHQLSDSNGQAALPHTSGSNPLLLRAITTDKYSRIWNFEVAEQLKALEEKEWRVPPARPAQSNQTGTRRATAQDVLSDQWSLSVKIGDPIAPAGLYASDHDMFAFLILENTRVDDGSEQGLSRGIFFENSEVGDRSLRCTTFLYRHVCGNHIVWDVSKVNKRRIIHRGSARIKFEELFKRLHSYQNASAKREEQMIKRARENLIAKTKQELIDKLFSKLYNRLTREQLSEAFEEAERNTDSDGNPFSRWGIVQGITRLSQQTNYTDERTKLDRAAGKVLRISF